MIDLSIIVPTLNTSGDLHQDTKIRYARKHCLESLLETTPQEVKIVIASNNGDPCQIDIPTHRDETPGRVKRINLWEQGQCKAVNAAVATTNTEWVMVTNDDHIYPPGWFDVLDGWIGSQGTLIRYPSGKLGTVSPVLVEPQKGAPTFIEYFCGGAGGDFDKQKFLDFVQEQTANKPAHGWATRSGFNLPFVVKRETWDLIGGYDINYDPWSSNSDSDLEYKIKLAGYQSIQINRWFVYHFSQTSGTFNPEHRDAWQRNWDYFEKKWGFPRTDEGIWEASFDIPYDKLKYRPKWAKIPS